MAGNNDLMMRFQLQLADKVSAPLQKMSASTKLNSKALKANRDMLLVLSKQSALVQKLKKEQEAFKRTSNAMKVNEVNLKALKLSGAATAAQIKAQTALVDKSTAAFNKQKDKLFALRSQANKAGIKNLAEDEKRLANQIGKTNDLIKRQETALKKIEQLKGKRDKALKAAAVVGGAGVGMSMLGRRGLNTGRSLLAPGMSFDTAMAGVQGTLGLDSNDPGLQALRAQILSYNKKDSTALTSGIAALAQHGFNTQDLITNIQPLLDMSDATRLSFEETANVVGSLMKGFNTDASQFAHVTDVLVDAANRGGVPLADLQEALANIAPTARAAGLSIEESAAMISAMSSSGIKASNAGNALNLALQKMQNPDPKALAALGIKGGNKDLNALFNEISKKTAGMSDAKQLEILSGIFSNKNAVAMAALMKQMRSGSYGETLSQLNSGSGAAAAQAIKNTQDLNDKVNELKASFSSLGALFFEENKEWLKEMAISLTGVATSVRDWLKANPKLVSTVGKLFLTISALLAVLGPVMTSVSALIAPMIMMRFLFGMLGVKGLGLIGTVTKLGGVFKSLFSIILTNPIGIAVAAFAAAAYAIYKNWDSIVWFFKDIWSQIKSAFDGGILGIGALILNWSPIGLFYKAFAAVLSWFGVDLPENFTTFAGNILSSFGNGILEAGKSILTWFGSIFLSIFNWFTIDLPKAFMGFGGMMMDGLINGIKNAVGAVKDAIFSIGESVVDWFREKLRINSPSKVFAKTALSIPEGIAVGITRGLPIVKKATIDMANEAQRSFETTRFQHSNNFIFDERAPVGAGGAGRSVTTSSNDTYQFYFYGVAGDPQAIRQAVEDVLREHERIKHARSRSSYID